MRVPSVVSSQSLQTLDRTIGHPVLRTSGATCRFRASLHEQRRIEPAMVESIGCFSRRVLREDRLKILSAGTCPAQSGHVPRLVPYGTVKVRTGRDMIHRVLPLVLEL